MPFLQDSAVDWMSIYRLLWYEMELQGCIHCACWISSHMAHTPHFWTWMSSSEAVCAHPTALYTWLLMLLHQTMKRSEEDILVSELLFFSVSWGVTADVDVLWRAWVQEGIILTPSSNNHTPARSLKPKDGFGAVIISESRRPKWC